MSHIRKTHISIDRLRLLQLSFSNVQYGKTAAAQCLEEVNNSEDERNCELKVQLPLLY